MGTEPITRSVRTHASAARLRAGHTLLECLVVLALLALLGGFALGAWRGNRDVEELRRAEAIFIQALRGTQSLARSSGYESYLLWGPVDDPARPPSLLRAQAWLPGVGAVRILERLAWPGGVGWELVDPPPERLRLDPEGPGARAWGSGPTWWVWRVATDGALPRAGRAVLALGAERWSVSWSRWGG